MQRKTLLNIGLGVAGLVSCIDIELAFVVVILWTFIATNRK